MSYPAHILVFHHPNNNWRVVQIMELLRQYPFCCRNYFVAEC